jgi:hypothetical protein
MALKIEKVVTSCSHGCTSSDHPTNPLGAERCAESVGLHSQNTFLTLNLSIDNLELLQLNFNLT